MRTGHTIVKLIACAAALAMASTPALAQTSAPTKLSGTATASGTFSRTIIDIGQPNGPVTGPNGILSTQSTTINVPYTIGQSADTIGVHLTNAINGNGALQGLGYSARPTTPSGAIKLNRPKMTRQTGGFTESDGSPPPGVSVIHDQFTVEDAPATSDVSLVLLAMALSLLVWLESRRRRKA